MSKDSIEKLAREKAEKAAKQEAWIAHFIAYLPFVLIACIMAVTRSPTVLYTVVILAGLFAGSVMYFVMKEYAYKKYYETYLNEFTILRRVGDKERV
jgi:VanZ family protein